MPRDPGVQRRRLDVKRNEKTDRDPGGQDRGQGRGQGHLHREFAVLPADFLAQVLDVNPHPTLLDLLSETIPYCPPAIDRASRQGRRMRSLWLLNPTPNSTSSFSCIAPGVELRERNIPLSRKSGPVANFRRIALETGDKVGGAVAAIPAALR